MDQSQKQTLLNKSVDHVKMIRSAISLSLKSTAKQLKKGKEEFKSLSPSDQVTASMLLAYGEKRLEELRALYPSPYFVRCDMVLDGESEIRSWYFAKFPLSENEVYSWTAPVASIRFENIGDVSYNLPDGDRQNGRLIRKDQFMIVDGKIVFMATESEDIARELVYQEHFSSRKQGFMLPEIIAQMEKAQDKVIRAHHKGSFVISGPAGSGKTTLALHRVAYLVQSPDTTHLYPTNSILVFVQDVGTRQYFSQLLPELGIHNVLITTYDEWAFDILDIHESVSYARHYGKTESERDRYEYAKIKAIRSLSIPTYTKNHFSFLESLYEPHFDDDLMVVFQKQKRERVVDRLDITALLMANKNLFGNIGKVKEYYEEQSNGKLKKKKGRVPFEYSLIVVDEFQNSLPEQLKILRSCVNQSLQSMIYVGDMAQQIHFGTIRKWSEIGEDRVSDRAVMLQKVYRNTKNILRYIQNLGYVVDIPDGMREGEIVTEYDAKNSEEEVVYIADLIRKKHGMRIGILAKHADYLNVFRDAFGKKENVHMFTIEESQGVEFDVVCIVGMRSEDWVFDASDMPKEFVVEKQKILKDLLYIALTRAISELHILKQAKNNA